jgi:hypothetical protein
MKTSFQYHLTRWTKRSALVAVSLLLIALLVPAESSGAQQTLTCDQARTTLLTNGGSRAQLVLATAKIIHCGDMAPTTVAATLRRATPNSTRDTLAQAAAFTLFDRRLLDSVRVLALDASQTAARRQVYLRLLTRYAAPLAAIDTTSLGQEPPKVLGAGGDGDGVVGTSPLGLEGRNWARATIQTMGFHDPDPRLRKLANAVGDQLQFFMQ